MTERAGRFRHRIRVERQSASRDALGSAENTYELIGHFWAALTTAGHGSDNIGESSSALPRWLIEMRATDAINVADRVSWDGHVASIVRITPPDTIEQIMTLFAEELRG
ncbi:MAG: head-tail adaptor protein [Parasphingorhabdus sp.]|nr:head-tail adaptor protein [Parasphingorhabdus sp.]